MTQAVSGRVVVYGQAEWRPAQPVWRGARGLAATLLDSCRLGLWPPYWAAKGRITDYEGWLLAHGTTTCLIFQS